MARGKRKTTQSGLRSGPRQVNAPEKPGAETEELALDIQVETVDRIVGTGPFPHLRDLPQDPFWDGRESKTVIKKSFGGLKQKEEKIFSYPLVLSPVQATEIQDLFSDGMQKEYEIWEQKISSWRDSVGQINAKLNLSHQTAKENVPHSKAALRELVLSLPNGRGHYVNFENQKCTFEHNSFEAWGHNVHHEWRWRNEATGERVYFTHRTEDRQNPFQIYFGAKNSDLYGKIPRQDRVKQAMSLEETEQVIKLYDHLWDQVIRPNKILEMARVEAAARLGF